MKRALLTGVLVVSCLWSGGVAGQPATANTTEVATTATEATVGLPRLAVGLGAVAGGAIGYRCAPTSSDNVKCTDKSLPLGIRFALRTRVSEKWAFGVLAGMDWLQGDVSSRRVTWRNVQLTGRYYLGRVAASQGWSEISAGVAQARDPVEGALDEHVSTWGPAASLAFGYDIAIARYCAVAPELRLQSNLWSNDAPHGGYYDSQWVIMAGFSVIGFGLYRP